MDSPLVFDIPIYRLAWASGLIFLSSFLSFRLRLGLEKDLLTAALRSVVQLALLSFILEEVFRLNSPFSTGALLLWMCFWSARMVKSRVKEKEVPLFWPTFIVMTLSYFLLTILMTQYIIQTGHWYKAQYFIPLGGMLAGNSLNAICLGLDRLFANIKDSRHEIEAKLALGASPYEAMKDIRPAAVRAAMIPSINSMAAVGLISIPGMMTGQILAGQAPVSAVKYQLMILLFINAAVCLVAILSLTWIERRCFNSRAQLKPEGEVLMALWRKGE